MKLLLDQNISRKLVRALEQLFPGTSHVVLVGLDTASDVEVWEYARDNNFLVVTQDSDFYERSLLVGFPPKVVWIRTGNTSSENIKKLLIGYAKEIAIFNDDESLGCLQIY